MLAGRPSRPTAVTDRAPEEIASRLLGRPYAALDPTAQNVALHVAQQRHIARDVTLDVDPAATRGQRAADLVTSLGGSWTFVGLFVAAVLLWVLLNAMLLRVRGEAFDPHPYILLNLLLSMLAAVQAPIILMSHTRHAAEERRRAAHDYEVNLKAEVEIMLLHDKLDALRHAQWQDLLALQAEQLRLLVALARSPAPQDRAVGS